MRILLSLVITTTVFVGCYPAKMALQSDDWPVKEVHKVEGKRGLFSRERMQFGQYHTTSVKRSWVKGNTSRFGLSSGSPSANNYTNLISLDYVNRRQTIFFSLADETNQYSEVFCASRFNSSTLVVGNRPNSIFNIGVDVIKGFIDQPDSKFYVQIYTNATEPPWELLVDNVQSQLHPTSYNGYLTKDRNNYYTIVPVHQMEGKDGKPASILFGTVGFEFRNRQGKPVAAVSLLNKGVVYLQPVSAEEKFLLANACAALLMQEVLG